MSSNDSKLKTQNSKLQLKTQKFSERKTQSLLTFWRNQTGQTLLELIVVVLISIVVIGALVFATISSLRNAQFAKNQAQATKLAQAGIELVRTGRDRDLSITNIPSATVSTWGGTAGSCLAEPTIKSDSMWCYQVYNGCGSGVSNTTCYFKLIPNNGSKDGTISYLTSSTVFPPSGTEDVYGDGKFNRVIVINDDSNTYKVQKTVTVIVRWTDFSGPHESKLTSVLRRL
ncbi:prepilin-type N-terminal cleavage/methylation domain-containing protein [Candidatus Daviesbacteria bacterium]|nr:prepilin-type N-terminal cleavage/methylation domain-containing protein [Candidatus Daviesbacteria bacterium]